MAIHGLVVRSIHEHLLLSPESPRQLAAFMDYVAGNSGHISGPSAGPFMPAS